jgi:putative redox protein
MSTRTVSARWLGGFQVQLTAGPFDLRVDEPESAGGTGTGPQPTDYLLASVASCFALAIAYSARKHAVALPGPLSVTATGTYDGARFSRIEIAVAGQLPHGMAERLLASAERVCYVTNTLRRPPEITIRLVAAGG